MLDSSDMVSNCKNTIADDVSCQVNFSSQLASSVKTPPFQAIPEKRNISDEEIEAFSQSHGEDRPAVDSISELSVAAEQSLVSRMTQCHYENDPGRSCSLKCMSINTYEDVIELEHMKRSRTGDDLHQHPFKRARQLDNSDRDVSFELPIIKAAHVEPLISVAACNKSTNDGDAFREEPSVDALAVLPCRPHLPLQMISSPHFVEKKDQTSGYTQPDGVYISILDYYPRKPVALGPNHQADIPAWRPRPVNGLPDGSDLGVSFHHLTDEDGSEKLMGTCIIPMPDDAAASLEDSKVSVGASGCSCPDEGSVCCVSRHIMEAREILKENLGSAKFIELGFPDMGEYVTSKWTEEEEQIFHEVDLVSYYFNVFILRKRAEQNRSDPLHIDSDNDEWQDGDGSEFAAEDYESDSVMKMPDDDHHGVYDDDSHEEDDFHEDDDDDDGDACDDLIAAEDRRQDLDDFLAKGHIQPISCYSSLMHLDSITEDHIIQDDSCTSFEGHHAGTPAAADGLPAVGFSRVGKDQSRSALNGMVDHGYLVSPDTKPWDLSYFPGQEKNVDFLPTCHVIEEVFGKGSWANESNDGQGIS
ncbi:unnamed protein product [Spirodela intermedia]|uniref:Uncharacterized protein n=1 Tax=Spirodela intermedia TaxID=51605 RepID=A0A7I8II68_SPIIN|nr:unnamed protein product [Spirodela intermedia]CAA6657416.1 unnamed protein product [Spirodela intermedia]